MTTHQNSNTNIPFIGGIIMSLIEPLKHLIDQHTFMTFDLFKALCMGIVGAIGSGLGTMLWTKYVKKRLKP